MNVEELGVNVWRAGDSVRTGIYLRVDDDSFRVVVMEEEGRLPASYDGHVAHYCRAPAMCLLNVQPEHSLAVPRNQPYDLG